MSLTPRQIVAYLEFGARLDRVERANDLVIAATAAQGKGQDIDKMVKELLSK